MCAVIKRGILGGFSNKIGNIVGSSWKGIAVMKSLPLSVANPKTAKQIVARDRFSFLSQLGSQLLTTIVKPLNDRFAQYESGFNKFVQQSKNAIGSDGSFVANQIILSTGKLDFNDITVITANGTTDVISYTYISTAGSGLALSTDKVYVLVMDDNGNVMVTKTTDTRGVAGSVTHTVSNPGMVAGQHYHFYWSFLRADGTIVSISSYRLAIAS